MSSFDSNLSEKYSLSRILDELFYDRTDSRTISAFLQMYSDEELNDIISNSDCIARVFQLDFLLALPQAGQDWILNKLMKIPMNLAATLSWQVCSAESSAADRLKFNFRKTFDWILRSNQLRHPYARSVSKDNRAIDKVFFEYAKHDAMMLAAEDFNKNMQFASFLRYKPCSSMFSERMYQEDFFSHLNLANAWELVQALDKVEFRIAYHFVRQVLSSDFGIGVKTQVAKTFAKLRTMRNRVWLLRLAFDNNEDMIYMYNNTMEFAPLYLNLAVLGKDNNSHVAMLMLMDERYDKLKEWLDYDGEELLNSIDIKDTIEALN